MRAKPRISSKSGLSKETTDARWRRLPPPPPPPPPPPHPRWTACRPRSCWRCSPTCPWRTWPALPPCASAGATCWRATRPSGATRSTSRARSRAGTRWRPSRAACRSCTASTCCATTSSACTSRGPRRLSASAATPPTPPFVRPPPRRVPGPYTVEFDTRRLVVCGATFQHCLKWVRGETLEALRVADQCEGAGTHPASPFYYYRDFSAGRHCYGPICSFRGPEPLFCALCAYSHHYNCAGRACPLGGPAEVADGVELWCHPGPGRPAGSGARRGARGGGRVARRHVAGGGAGGRAAPPTDGALPGAGGGDGVRCWAGAHRAAAAVRGGAAARAARRVGVPARALLPPALPRHSGGADGHGRHVAAAGELQGPAAAARAQAATRLQVPRAARGDRQVHAAPPRAALRPAEAAGGGRRGDAAHRRGGDRPGVVARVCPRRPGYVTWLS
ncbi:uncharacterized protein LOC126295075 [Schistocerca gregaria]|uniref:uncharacterized protein LOC126295075 n=1 Tax=Schistocerca gregaria TaxID=7010 RepID=UPI00211DE391|nr:uncharacterized protein LOC126295075 [Schistocerca gregaria]